MRKVLKFGGTSVGSAEAVRQVCRIVKASGPGTLVVVSAFAGVTDRLAALVASLERGDERAARAALSAVAEKCSLIVKGLRLGDDARRHVGEAIARVESLIPAIVTLGEVTPRAADTMLATGEIVSSFAVASLLHTEGLAARHLDARSVMVTDDRFGCARPDEELTAALVRERLLPLFEECDTVVTGGYIGATSEGITTTLGRGGSDYSAAIFAAAAGAEECEIWSDVDGIMTSDPRIIPAARTVPHLTYDEAAELAYFGAKVLHPLTIQPAVRRCIPVTIRNTFAPERSGTRILPAAPGNGHGIKAVAFQRGITVLHIRSNRMLGAYGFLAAVFEVFRDHRTPVDLVTTSEVSISVTIDDRQRLDGIIAALSRLGEVSAESGGAILSLIGEGMRSTAGIGARFFSVLKDINIGMVSVGASEVNLSIVLAERDLDRAARLIHGAFFEGGTT